MAWVIPAIGAGISLYSAVSNARAQRRTNRQEVELADTAIQRRMRDMKAAGINPALAYMSGGLGPAQTPNLDAPQYNTGVSNDIRSAYETSSARSLLALQKAQLEAGVRLTNAQTMVADQSARKIKDERQFIIPATGTQLMLGSQKLEAEAQNLAKDFQIKFAQIGLTEEQARGEKLRNDQLLRLQPELIKYQEYINQALALDIPEKKANAAFFENMPSGRWNDVLKTIIQLRK